MPNNEEMAAGWSCWQAEDYRTTAPFIISLFIGCGRNLDHSIRNHLITSIHKFIYIIFLFHLRQQRKRAAKSHGASCWLVKKSNRGGGGS